MSVKTVKVSNISLKATEKDIQEFFSFSGEIRHLEVKCENEEARIAYITFKDAQGADTAVLLTGATIAEKLVTISLDPEYELPPGAAPPPQDGTEEAFRKAEDVVTTMLAKGFVLGKDAVNQAKTFDEKHQLTSTASTKIQSIDEKYGVTEKISVGTTAVNSKVKEMDEKYQVSEKTKSAVAVAEEKVTSVGSVLMKNRYLLTGASWVTGAYNRVTQAAVEVGQKTLEKVDKVEEEKKQKAGDQECSYTQFPESNSSKPVPLEASPRSISPKPSSPPKDEIALKDASEPKPSSLPKNSLLMDASPATDEISLDGPSEPKNASPPKDELALKDASEPKDSGSSDTR